MGLSVVLPILKMAVSGVSCGVLLFVLIGCVHILLWVIYTGNWSVCVLTVLFSLISFVKGGQRLSKCSSNQCSVMVENEMSLFSSTWRLRASATTFVAPDSNWTWTSYKDIVCSHLATLLSVKCCFARYVRALWSVCRMTLVLCK